MAVGALLCACATGGARERFALQYRPARPGDCEIEFYGGKRPRPEHLVELGRMPITVGFYTPPAAVEKAVRPKACEAGALAVELIIPDHARVVGGRERVKDVELVFLGLTAEETVTETRALATGAALKALSREAAAGVLPPDA